MSAYYLNPKKIVDAQQIVFFEFDPKTTAWYMGFGDGHTEIQPSIHGYKPRIGDYLITVPVQTERSGGAPYAEKSERYIVPAGWFHENCAAVPADDMSSAEVFVGEPLVKEPAVAPMSAPAAALAAMVAAAAPAEEPPVIEGVNDMNENLLGVYAPLDGPVSPVAVTPETVEVPQDAPDEVKEQ